MKKLYLFIISLTFFSFGIFIFKNYFLGTYKEDLNNQIESNYIDPVKKSPPLTTPLQEENKKEEELQKNTPSITPPLQEENKKEEELYKRQILTKAKKDIIINSHKVGFLYYPKSFGEEILSYTNTFKTFLYTSIINSKIDLLKVELYKEKEDTRGKMKDRRIKLFGIDKMSLAEYISVGIHEFAHFLDLYYYKEGVFTDFSDFFYNISWDGVKVIKSGQIGDDFVSGYAMTNKYEDFAETFTYFVLHNSSFKKKSENSVILKKKYDFFNDYLFKDKNFENTDFSLNSEILPYYRDITKIDFSLDDFLDFLNKIGKV